MQKQLRILIIVDLPMDARLGASQVYVELANAWRAAGHTVASYALNDAFPTQSPSRLVRVIRQCLFPWKAAAFVRNNADSFDVIDSLLGTLPFSKRNLRFDGLLVARSVGLYRLYHDFDRMARARWPSPARENLLGRILYVVLNKWAAWVSRRALRHSDLVNVPNDNEVTCLQRELRSRIPVLVQPYGLTAERQQTFQQAAVAAARKLAARKISFIGMWTVRKGAKDWGEIIRRVRALVPEARFVFLGTLTDDDNVLRDLGLASCDYVELVREYSPEQLPQLLSDSTVGAFPSYAEGFGLAVLEQLAAGIPVVAYDAPGPMSILQKLSELLVPVGSVGKLSEALVRILSSDLNAYQKLAEQAVATAKPLIWSTIAEDTAEAYRTHLATVKSARND
jgi:glycosyltransferase involved in cell wall biosynthesis